MLLLLASLIWFAGTNASQTYDFIVIGGGTGGITVGARLSQRLPDASILIIEAGPDGRDVPGIYIPGLKGSTLGTIYDWNFTTVPQPHCNNRVLDQNRGKVLGGSSALNLLAWDRGTKADYNAWEELGNEGWNWTSMHAAMESAETFQLTSTPGGAGVAAAGGVGYDGPIHSRINRFDVPQVEHFFPTMTNLGLHQTFTFLNGDMLEWMRHTSNILDKNYTRCYSPSFLARAGPGLHLMLNTTVAKVNLNKSACATGVTLADGTIIEASKEIILSAGSIQSPQLLELSGIGNKTVLSAAGVEQLIDLPGVGENLQDHIRITAAYQLKPNYTSPDKLHFNTTFAAEQMDLYKHNISSFYDETGIAYAYITWDQAGLDASRFVHLAEQSAEPSSSVDQLKLAHLRERELRVPQLEVIFSDGYTGNKGYPVSNSPLYGKQFFTLIASINHAYSRGNVHINSSDVKEYPVLNPNYLSNPYDLYAVAQGAKYLRKIATTPPMSYAWVDEYEPGFDVITTDADWKRYARRNAVTIWHPLGTCAMLPKKDGGVVDPDLKVYGVTNLRVVDASVIPILVSGHIQTSVYGIAERAAGLIAES